MADRVHLASHTWMKRDGNFALFGIDEFLSGMLPRIEGVAFLTQRTDVIPLHPCAWILFEEGSIAVPAPAGVTHPSPNVLLAEEPSLVRSSPYDAGYLLRFAVTNEETAFPSSRGELIVREEWEQERFVLQKWLHELCDDRGMAADGGIPADSLLELIGASRLERCLRRLIDGELARQAERSLFT